MITRRVSEGSATSKIETYRNVIAELEKQIAHESFWLDTAKPDVPGTLSDDPEFAFSTKIENLLNLSKFALQTDSTRVITLSLGNTVRDRVRLGRRWRIGMHSRIGFSRRSRLWRRLVAAPGNQQ